jgi:hypothetical protein
MKRSFDTYLFDLYYLSFLNERAKLALIFQLSKKPETLFFYNNLPSVVKKDSEKDEKSEFNSFLCCGMTTH